MSEIVTKFSSDDKEMTAAFQRQQREIEKLREGLRRAKEDGAAAAEVHKEGSRFLSEQAKSIGNMVAGLVTVDKLAQIAREAYSDWSDDVKELADQHKTLEETLIRTITKAGQLANAPQIEKALAAIPGATRGQGAAAFGGVAGAAPGMSLGRQLAISRSIAPYGATGIDLGEYGTVAGKVAELAPGKSAGDIADLVASLQQQAGADFGEFGNANTMRAVQSLLSSGAVKTPEEALGLGISAHGANLKPGILTDIARAVTESVDQSKLRTPEMLAYQNASPAQRMAMLRGNEAVRRSMLGDNAVMMQMMPGGAGPAEQLAQAQRGDLASGLIGGLASSSAGARAAMAQGTAVERDVQAQGFWGRQGDYKRSIDESMKAAGYTGMGGYFSRSGQTALYSAETAFGGADPELSAIKALREAQENRSRLQIERGEGRTAEQQRGFEYLERQINILQQIEANQKKNTNLNAHIERE